MKLSELRPCDKCGGKLVPTFYVVRFSQALFNAKHANAVIGLNTIFGGRALALAETMAPGADEAVLVFGDKEKQLETELLICEECFMNGPLDLAALWEVQMAARRKAEEEARAW